MSQTKAKKRLLTLKTLLLRYSFTLVGVLGTLAAISVAINWALIVPKVSERLEYDTVLARNTFVRELELAAAAEDAILVAEQVDAFTQTLDFKGIAVLLPDNQILYALPESFGLEAFSIRDKNPSEKIIWSWSDIVTWAPIDVEGTPLGVVALSYSSTNVRILQAAFGGLLGLLILFALAAAVYINNFAGRFVEPLERLTNFSISVGQGNFKERLETNNEVAEVQLLINQMNSMATQLQGQHLALVEARQEAEALSEMKSRFLANMSHEMRTPLNGVLGITESLLEKSIPKSIHNDLKIIQVSARNLVDIIDNVLDFSRLQSKQLIAEEKSCLIPEIVRSASRSVLPQLRGKGLKFHVELGPNVPRTIISDPLRIRQILLNLLSNAVKFTQKGGIYVSIGRQDNHIYFSIKDDGIGMTEAELSEAYNAFQQADVSTTRQYGGTGIGLSISKSLANLLGGDIAAVSQKGMGSTFTFSIPLKINPKARPAKPEYTFYVLGRLGFVDKQTKYLQRYGAQKSDVASTAKVLVIDCENIESNQLLELHSKNAQQTYQASIGIAQPSLWLNNHELRSDLDLDQILVEPVFPEEIFEAADHALINPENNPVELLKGHTVLVVEDNPVNQKVAVRALEQLGLQTIVAENGAIAVDRIVSKNTHVDLILMDLQMPVMDGYEAALQIRKVKNDIPIVALTADAVPDAHKRCIEVGMNDFITKPIRRPLLTEKLINYIIKK